MIQRFRIGNNLSINWLLYEDDGNIHNLEGKTLELYMTCGGYKYPVTDYTVTENAIAWVFPANRQTKTGYYKLVLVERDPVNGLYSFDVAHAFCLEPKHALTNIETIIDEDSVVQVRSVLTYAHITNLASIDTVTTGNGEGKTVVVHLTNGKSFTLPFNPGEGGAAPYVLPAAKINQLGGIKVGFQKVGNKYPVLLDRNDNAYVEVPVSGGGDDGGGGGSGSGNGVNTHFLVHDDNSWPERRSDGLDYFDPDYLATPNGKRPVAGDVILYFGDWSFLDAWEVVRIETSGNKVLVVGTMTVDENDLFFYPKPVNSLDSESTKAPLSANMGRALRELVEDANRRIVLLKNGYFPNYERSEDLYYFDSYIINTEDDNRIFSRLPSVGDYIWFFGNVPYDGILFEWEVVSVELVNPATREYLVKGKLIKQIEIMDHDGGSPSPGDPGRSITSVEHWFKLCADESVQATPMSVADPSSSAGGSWSLTAGSPTVQYPYLRCFMQVNYDTPLASGYTYTRSSAFTARYFNSDSSVEYDELVNAISSLRADLLSEISDREAAIVALNTALEGLRSTLSGSIANQLTELRNRLNQISGTDVELIMNDGLWAVLTSWQNETGDKKAFADIIANAEQAKITLQNGSTFFDHSVGGSFTLDGILGMISAKVTRQDVNAMIASAQFSVDPSSLNSVISKSQACWKKNEILYPYDLYLTDYMTANPSATLADYETYMTAQSGGPSGDSTRPAGPFELVVVVEQFSAIKQTMDEISASVDTTKYMWMKGNQYASYNAFETNWENRSSAYSAYTYEQYVTNVLGYTKIEVGAALSNITQSSDEIRAIIGDMGYFWRKPASGGGYEYQRYAVPSNQTRDAYVASMQTAGWSLVTYASRMSVIDQFPDSITALVKKSTLCWVDETATGAAYCHDYEYWMPAYQRAITPLSYEDWVYENHPSYELMVFTDSVSRIKQTADSITSAVADIEGHETRLSAVEQTAEEISLSVSKVHSCWKDNATGELYEYNAFAEAYETYKESTQNPLDYEDWVENTQNCTLTDSFSEVSGIKLQGDKIWAGVGDRDDLKASIEIIADAETDEGKIILDADNVIINGGLQAGVVKAGAIDAKAVTTEKLDTGAVTAAKIDAGAVTTDKLAANAVTAGKIDAGAVTTDKLDAGSVTAAKIATGAITADKIGAGEVTADKIATGAITADKIAAGAITVDDLLAVDANIAGFIFQNQRLESQSLDDGGEPKLSLNGRTGKLIAQNAEIKGKIDAETGKIGKLTINQDGTLSGDGGIFVDGTIAGRIPIYTNDPLIETKVSSPINLGYRDSGAFIGAYASAQINLLAGVATHPGFHIKILVMNAANTISINGSALRPSWLRFDGSNPNVGTYSTGSSISFSSVGLYELIYVGKETYTGTVNGRSGTYDKFVLCKLS